MLMSARAKRWWSDIDRIYVFCMDTRSVLLTQYCAGGKIEKNEMGGACGGYGVGERCAQGSGWET